MNTNAFPWEGDRDAVSLRFVDDHDGTGELFVVARANGFAGRSSAWLGVDELLSFAAHLVPMPIANDPPPSIRGGFFGQPGSAGLAQEHVAIEVRRASSTGQLAVAVHLATPVGPGDDPQRQHDLHLEPYTTYERLRQFGRDIRDMAEGRRTHATIEAEHLGGRVLG